MWMCVVQAVSRDHVDVCGPGYLQRLSVNPCSMLLLTVKGKEITFAEALMAEESELKKREMECFCDNACSHPSHITK